MLRHVTLSAWGRRQQVVEGHRGAVTAVAWSPYHDFVLASGSR
jgi:hypothetical protein